MISLTFTKMLMEISQEDLEKLEDSFVLARYEELSWTVWAGNDEELLCVLYAKIGKEILRRMSKNGYKNT